VNFAATYSLGECVQTPKAGVKTLTEDHKIRAWVC